MERKVAARQRFIGTRLLLRDNTIIPLDSPVRRSLNYRLFFRFVLYHSVSAYEKACGKK